MKTGLKKVHKEIEMQYFNLYFKPRINMISEMLHLYVSFIIILSNAWYNFPEHVQSELCLKYKKKCLEKNIDSVDTNRQCKGEACGIYPDLVLQYSFRILKL